MSGGTLFAIVFVCVALLMAIVGFIGNKIVDKGSDTLRNHFVRKRKAEHPNTPESLAERYTKGRKL